MLSMQVTHTRPTANARTNRATVYSQLMPLMVRRQTAAGVRIKSRIIRASLASDWSGSTLSTWMKKKRTYATPVMTWFKKYTDETKT